MVVVGFDVGKDSVFGARIDRSGVVKQHWELANTPAALLIAETGDITRFKDAGAVVAYVGLDPRAKQSGATLRRDTRLTKRGSPYLKQALYLAAASDERHGPELKAVFSKKRAEGKRYKAATIVIVRKLVARIYTVRKRGTPYSPKIA